VHDLPGPLKPVALPHCRPWHVCSAASRSQGGFLCNYKVCQNMPPPASVAYDSHA
jgi:hypothetical protein